MAVVMPQTFQTYKLLKQLLDHTPDVVFFKDKDSRYLEFNDTMLKLLGVPREALIGKDTRGFLPEELTEQILREDQEVMESGKPMRKENWVQFSDGSLALMDTIIAPILDEAGESIGLLGIGRDITELKNTSAALKEKNLALEKINHELDTLIYHAAHDLRAPLTSILGLVNVMREEQDRALIIQYLDLQEEKIKRLDTFIQDIVDLSKNSREGIVVGNVHLAEIFDDLVGQFRFLPGAPRIRFECFQTGPPIFRSDHFRLSLVLSNLLSNAVRYHEPTRDEPFVQLNVEIDEMEATIRLHDNGVGIPAQYVDQIFDMFFRAHKSSKGSGIGLYITRETVHKLGGEITVESVEGEGTTFTVKIPNHLEGQN